MPQVQSGQIDPNAPGAPALYGVDKVENAVPFQERLMRLFKPQDFVTIKNITDQLLTWQYMPPDGEVESFSEDGTQRIITRTAPELWQLAPGATEAIVGMNAYRALDAMYKNYSAFSTLRKYADPTSPLYNEEGKHIPKNFNFSDGGAQDAFIKKAYLGKATPSFESQEPVPVAPRAQTVAAMPAASTEYADPTNTTLKTADELKSAGTKSK